ncbi:DnaK suppressor protein [Paenibacillus sp. JCM 10914]|nr:DnaK suppressor protein [Paenibacillus sp. JCM 10914]
MATELYEREKDLALQDRVDLELQRVIFSLENIHHGRYGVCTICGQPIPYERLEAVPDTQYCIKDTPREHLSFQRPVEEEVMAPPFGKSSMDEHDYAAFDGEDAWQIVESWGTSNTPAMAENNDVDSYDEMAIENGDDLGGFVEPTRISWQPTSMVQKYLSCGALNIKIISAAAKAATCLIRMRIRKTTHNHNHHRSVEKQPFCRPYIIASTRI